MRTKHFVNDANKLVDASLKSLCIIRPELHLDLENKILYSPRDNLKPGQVSIISGGGSGHEPSFTGLVGEGLLSASVVGTIFASPSSRQVLKAIENVDGSKGVLVTVMNYTGDVLNFGVALEKAKARNPSLKVEMLVVGDDVSVTRRSAGKVGRRGIAGTVLVHKITGALASAGFTLDEVFRIGRLVVENLVSIGVSLSRVHVPGRPREEILENTLGIDEVELGMGIHNEAGCARKSAADASLPSLIREMLSQLLDTSDIERHFLSSRTNEMVLLINNLGALSVLELGAVVTEIAQQLREHYQIKPARVYAGTFMTSLDGPGFSISLLNVVDTGIDRSLLDLLDASSNASGWHATTPAKMAGGPSILHDGRPLELDESEKYQSSKLNCDLNLVQRRLQSGLLSIISSEPEITRYDDIVGDGDCGTTLKRGADSILEDLAKSPVSNVIDLLTRITSVAENTMDGTSGALYAIFLNNLTHYFKLHNHQAISVDGNFWSLALDSALNALSKYTPAQLGDRTIMDALISFSSALKSSGDLRDAARAAKEAALKTMHMRPGLGRSVYIGNEERWLGKIPDPGAWGLSVFLEGLVTG